MHRFKITEAPTEKKSDPRALKHTGAHRDTHTSKSQVFNFKYIKNIYIYNIHDCVKYIKIQFYFNLCISINKKFFFIK